MFSWQRVKSRSYHLAAGSGKEIRAFPVCKWQNIKMLRCCVPKDDKEYLSLMKNNMNIQNSHSNFPCNECIPVIRGARDQEDKACFLTLLLIHRKALR